MTITMYADKTITAHFSNDVIRKDIESLIRDLKEGKNGVTEAEIKALIEHYMNGN